MKTKIYNYLLLLSGALLLTGCPPPEQTTPPELNNQFSYDGQIYNITAVEISAEDAVYLSFESGDDIEAYFTLHLGEGVFRITESGTFTFNEAADGTPGTFSEGGFSNKTTEAEVISGTITVEVSGDVYDIKADCKCENGKELKVRYTGALEYYGPTGTTTFEIGDLTFPYAAAGIYATEWDEYYNAYTTEIYILASNMIDVFCECELDFLHSNPSSLAGTYTFGMGAPSGAGAAYGELWAGRESEDESEDESISGVLSEGTVTIEIEGDVYTITFDGVKLYTGSELIDVTGAYAGTLETVTDY